MVLRPTRPSRTKTQKKMSLVAQRLKHLPAMGETRVWSLGQKDPGEGNGDPLQYSCLQNPWWEELGRLHSTGSQRVRHNWMTSFSLFTFHHRGLECKSRKSETPGETGKSGLRVQTEAGQRQIEICQENALVIGNTLFQQHKRWLYTWTSPDGQHRNQIDYILCSRRWKSSIQSAKTRPGADCGSDHQLLIAKFRLKLKKVGKTTRPFKYDLNHISNDYTVEVRNRFKGLDLIDRVPEELRTEVHDIVQEAVIKTIPKKKKCAACASSSLTFPMMYSAYKLNK